MAAQVLGQRRSCNRGGSEILEVVRQWMSCNIEVLRQWSYSDNVVAAIVDFLQLWRCWDSRYARTVQILLQ